MMVTRVDIGCQSCWWSQCSGGSNDGVVGGRYGNGG